MDLLKKLPKDYKALSWQKYVKIINSIPAERPDGIDDASWSRLINLTTLSILLDMDVAAFDSLRATELIPLIKGIDYLNKPIVEAKTAFKIKAFNELTYDEFTTYQTLKADQWNNLGAILGIMVKDITPEQVEELSIYEVQQIFFLSSSYLKKYLTRSRFCLILKLITKLPRVMFRIFRKR